MWKCAVSKDGLPASSRRKCAGCSTSAPRSQQSPRNSFAGFAFVERQKRITLDGDDYYIDLLFFHRRMRRLVAIELKIGDFKPADSGQMELYLRWLDKHERQTSEESPLGIILCAGKKHETVEYLNLDGRGIHVAEYLTELPAREFLKKRLRRVIDAARG